MDKDPNAIQEVPTISSNMTPEQSVALASSQAQANESNKYIFLRVKSVLVIGILLAASSLLQIMLSLGKPDAMPVAIIGFVQLAITSSLFLSKNKNTVSLILKIFLVLQLVGLFMSLSSPDGLIINVFMVILLGYAYTRVKSLSY